MPKPLPRVPHVESPFVLRAELLTLVPHSMSTIDRLEAERQFPKRIRLEPTNRVGWLRSEVIAYLRHLAKRRRSAAQEGNVKAPNQESKKSSDRDLSPTQSERSGPALEHQPANPGHQLAPTLDQAWRFDRISERRGSDDD